LVSGAWVGGDEPTVRFKSGALGEGASAALPIWAMYMQKVYADKTLAIPLDNFMRPDRGISVELNCNPSGNQQLQPVNEFSDDEEF